MSRRVTTPALVLRHLRARSGGSTVAGLVLLLALVATLAPLALGTLADAALRDRLSSLGALDRDVATTVAGLPQSASQPVDPALTGDEVWAAFQDSVDQIRTQADPPLPSLLAPARMVGTSLDLPLAETAPSGLVTVAFDPAYADEIRIVEGRAPEPATAQDVPQDGEVNATVEIVLSTDTAAEIDWPVGEARTTSLGGYRTAIVLTGLFEAVDAQSDYWQHVSSVLQPNIFDDGNRPRTVTGTGYANPASLPIAFSLPGRQETTVWFPFDTSGIDASTAPETAAALRKLTAVSHTIGSSADGVGILSLRFTADVTATIEQALAQQAATAGLIAMIIAGPVGVAAAVLVLGCRLVLERRRSALRLLSARGASVGQLRSLLGTEGALLGVVPALLGLLLGLAVGRITWGSAFTPALLLPALLLALAPPVILAALAAAASERPARADLGRRGSRVRLIAEGIVLALAAAAVSLLFLRGTSSADGVDLLQAATPLLLALVACLITLRLYPLPLRRVLESARRAPALGSFLGAARALREPAIGLTPVLALVVGVSVAVSSGVLLSSLQEGVTRAAQAEVGADLKVTGGSFTAEQLARVQAIEGVEAATGISGAETATLDIDGQKRPTSVFVVDAADLRTVQGEGPGLLPAGTTLEQGADPVPVIVAAATAERIDGSEDVRVNATDVEVVGVSSGPSPIGTRENWVAIDASYAPEVIGRDPSDRTLLLALTPAASVDDVSAAVRTQLGGSVRIESVDRIVAGIQSSPSVQGVRISLLAATGIAALLSALAIVMTLTLAARPRARVLALLRTLGAPRRSATSLALWEIGPPAIAAIIAGTVFGAIVPLVVLAGVDLRSFTGSSVQPGYHVDAVTLAITLGGFVLLGAAFTVVALWVSRRARAASALRTVEEG
ncbi:FtsX-like permease family protein [uncultured Microbacterium sp.]|uniref:FtsX-like permease family protein n=1 Tax=uncultured Microbacterium sp. TaxID=191216 RepID=UPI0028D303E3|nr:FtsX-like permease family protein [uncultured Microbacterium sp.]